jgi:hypothetical protein
MYIMYNMSHLQSVFYFAVIIIIVVILINIYNYYQLPYYELIDIHAVELFAQQTKLPKSKIAIACLMRKPLDLSIWLQHHRDMGICHFYIRLEDTKEQIDFLKAQNDVSLEVAESDKEGNNYETLQSRQIEFVDKSLKYASNIDIEWLFHIDADELLHGELQYLDTLETKYKTVRIQNVEALFDDNRDNDTCFSAVKFLKCSKGAPCRSYINGKSAGRVTKGVSLKGPHFFQYNGKYIGEHVYETPFNVLKVLHFDSCSFSAWIEKFHHLSKKKTDNIPFKYYNESIDAVDKAYDIYKKFSSPKAENIKDDLIYYKSND